MKGAISVFADRATPTPLETGQPTPCCPLYHEAVELIGRRWSGAILEVLLSSDRALRFTEIAQAVPPLSDRMLSERLKELEDRGVLTRCTDAGAPRYALTDMGRGLEPALAELKLWAQRWMCD